MLTYTPDNKIIITPKWMGLMESGMVQRVLNIPAWLDRKKLGITIGGERHVIKQGGSLTLKYEGECLSVDSKEVIYSYYVNRKASNNVRLQYSGFMQYMHGFLQLRKDMDTNKVRVSMMEMADNIGYNYKDQGVWRNNNSLQVEKVWEPSRKSVRHVEDKPQEERCLGVVLKHITKESIDGDPEETLWSAYTRQCSSFFAAISNTQPEEGKVDNYYRMTLTLLAMSMPYLQNNPKIG
jgi:hypothetical protein